jgi:hypothetical protein
MAVMRVAKKRAVGTLERHCPKVCTLGHPGKFTAEQIELIHGWYEGGVPFSDIRARCVEFPGITFVDIKSVGRHFHEHLSPAKVSGRKSKVNSISVLETVISEGFANAGRWRPSLADTMRAIQLLNQLKGGTQNSAYEELENAIAAAVTGDYEDVDADDEDGEVVENPAALGLDDERGDDE